MERLEHTLNRLIGEFDLITPTRKKLLNSFAELIRRSTASGQPVRLNFICTHNSRRSHISQVWAQKAAAHYGIPGVTCLSGGTEATAFNPRAVKALQGVGFDIRMTRPGDNPVYEINVGSPAPLITAFSKRYDDDFNLPGNYMAVMTCSHADEGCPVVTGASARVAITYDDPKEFDGTPLEEAKYLERVLEIGREMLYAFSLVG